MKFHFNRMENDEWKEYSFETWDELEEWMEKNIDDFIEKNNQESIGKSLYEIKKLDTTDSTVNSA